MGRIKNWDKRLDNAYKVAWTNRLTGDHLEINHVLGKGLYIVELLMKEHPTIPIKFGPFRTKGFAMREAVRLMKKYTGAKR
jgi:hypothetical protein